MLIAQDNLSDFSATFERYWKLTSKTRLEALAHVGKSYSIEIYRRLKTLAHPRGEIFAEVLADIHGGLKISDRAREIYAGLKEQASAETGRKRFSGARKQAIRRLGGVVAPDASGRDVRVAGKGGLRGQLQVVELRLRDARRMFAAAAVLFKGKPESNAPVFSVSNGGKLTGRRQLVEQTENGAVVFEWDKSIGKWSAVAARSLTSPRCRHVFGAALMAVRQDNLRYIQRKQDEAARAAARTIRSI